MLTGRTAAEILAAYHDVPFHHVAGKRRILMLIAVLHAMSRQILRVKGVQIACRNNHIRINIVAVAPNLSL